MSIRNVQHVFDAAAFKLSTDGLLDDDVVGLLRRQDLIDLLGGSQGINLVRLQRRKKQRELQFEVQKYHVISSKYCGEFFINTSLTSSFRFSRLMSEYSGKLVTTELEQSFTVPSSCGLPANTAIAGALDLEQEEHS